MKGTEKEELLTATEAAGYKASMARANYLGSDRPDLQYSVKELRSNMSMPTKADMRKATEARARVFKFQRTCEDMNGDSDSDWAGCRRTASSTSGEVILRGSHFVKSWAPTQKDVTLSSKDEYGIDRIDRPI